MRHSRGLTTLPATFALPPDISTRPRPQLGEHPFDLFAVEVWEQIIGHLDPRDAFLLRATCTAFRFTLRDRLVEVLMARESLASLRNFAAENTLLTAGNGGRSPGASPRMKGRSPRLGPASPGSGGGSLPSLEIPPLMLPPSSASLPSLSIPPPPHLHPATASASSPSLAPPPASDPTHPTTLILRLHHHLDAFLARALGPEPDRHTDDFTLWVSYDATLTGLALAELRDAWLRRGGGSRGRSRSRLHADWEAARDAMAGELRGLLGRVWALLGKLFPYSKAENAAWKERRARRAAEAERRSRVDLTSPALVPMPTNRTSIRRRSVPSSFSPALDPTASSDSEDDRSGPPAAAPDDSDPGLFEWGRPNEWDGGGMLFELEMEAPAVGGNGTSGHATSWGRQNSVGGGRGRRRRRDHRNGVGGRRNWEDDDEDETGEQRGSDDEHSEDEEATSPRRRRSDSRRSRSHRGGQTLTRQPHPLAATTPFRSGSPDLHRLLPYPIVTPRALLALRDDPPCAALAALALTPSASKHMLSRSAPTHGAAAGVTGSNDTLVDDVDAPPFTPRRSKAGGGCRKRRARRRGDVEAGEDDETWDVGALLACLRRFARVTEASGEDGTVVLRFPSCLDATARKKVHEAAARLGLRTRSFGDGAGRFVVAFRAVGTR
ncbi:hypothetical protein HDU96_003971 [Phlyctochytrium bullatum]|nr:hypothetical protein HDU96_003971 [Phlyctochytrium bullatum]